MFLNKSRRYYRFVIRYRMRYIQRDRYETERHVGRVHFFGHGHLGNVVAEQVGDGRSAEFPAHQTGGRVVLLAVDRTLEIPGGGHVEILDVDVFEVSGA